MGVPCPSCAGSGGWWSSVGWSPSVDDPPPTPNWETCSRCDGMGEVDETDEEAK